MNIQNITHFVPLTWPVQEERIASASRFLKDAGKRFSEAGLKVQALNLAMPPFLDVLGHPDPDLLLEYGQTLDTLATRYGINGVSIGPVQATTPLALLMSIKALPKLIASTEKISSGVLFADRYSGINIAATYNTAQIIQQIGQTTPYGQGNLRLGLLANVPAHVPFLAAAYQHGFDASFALAVDIAPLALAAITNARSLNKARQQFTEALEVTGKQINSVTDTLIQDHQLKFNGVDYSATGNTGAFGQAMKQLGVDTFSSSGTLAALLFLVNAIQQAHLPYRASSGTRLPLFGDPAIAAQAARGTITISDLLLYSAINSGGLDLVPIPGDTSTDEIAAILLDIAALANATNKPISMRLLPVPNKVAGDKVTIENLGDGVVLPVKGLAAKGLLEQSSFFSLTPSRSSLK